MAARPRRLSRRGLLGTAGIAGLLAGCGASPDSADSPDRADSPGRADSSGRAASPESAGARQGRHYYGHDHANQFADLRLPTGAARGTVVLLHGGYWLPAYGLGLMEPLASRLNALGYATWNVEYRRTGAGGGYPETLTDVARAIDGLVTPGPSSGPVGKVVLLGHSAGGHLAGWAASRSARTPGGAPEGALAGAISLSGVLNLTLAASDPRSSAPVAGLMGGSPAQRPRRYALADPALLVPAACPVWAVHATEDTVVSAVQSTSYVGLARAAGGAAEEVPVPGDHFALIDPRATCFTTISRLVTTATT